MPENSEEAVRWFRQAAVRGVTSSMYLLGECLLEGLGTAQNTSAAFGWLAAAAELGHRSARERVLSAYSHPTAPVVNQYLTVAGRRGGQWDDLDRPPA